MKRVLLGFNWLKKQLTQSYQLLLSLLGGYKMLALIIAGKYRNFDSSNNKAPNDADLMRYHNYVFSIYYWGDNIKQLDLIDTLEMNKLITQASSPK